MESLSAVTASNPRGYLEKGISMTYRQRHIRRELEDWENYINLFHGKLSEPMLVIAMEQRKIRLDLLLKIQTEEYDPN